MRLGSDEVRGSKKMVEGTEGFYQNYQRWIVSYSLSLFVLCACLNQNAVIF